MIDLSKISPETEKRLPELHKFWLGLLKQARQSQEGPGTRKQHSHPDKPVMA